MKCRLLILLVALLSVVTLQATAQHMSDEYAVRNLNVAKGLSQNTVRTLAFDKQGFLWVGTFDGLNRFDGLRFKTYKPEKHAPYLTLSDSQIRSVNVDASGLLWVRTYDNSFSLFDPETEKFIQITDTVGEPLRVTQGNVLTSPDSLVLVYGVTNGAALFRVMEDHTVNCIWQDDELYRDGVIQGNRLWITGKNAICLDKNGIVDTIEFDDMTNGSRGFTLVGTTGLVSDGTSVIKRFDARNMRRLPDITVPDDVSVTDIKLISQDIVALNGRSQGVRFFDALRHMFVSPTDIGAEEIEGTPMKFIVDNTGKTWFLSGDGVLYHYDSEKRTIHSVRTMPSKTAHVVDDMRLSIHADRYKKNIYWITSYGGGLVRFDEDNNTSEKITSELNVMPDYLLTITQDASGNIITGSEYVGLVIISERPYVSRVIRPAVADRLNAQNNIRVAYESENGNVWMGVRNSHLYVYDKTLTQELYKRENLKPYAITSDNEGRIWIGTRGQGIYVYDCKTFSELAHYTHDNDDEYSLSNNNIFKIVMDAKGRIWIATFGGGVDLLENASNLNKTAFHHFLTSNAKRKNNIRDLYEDSEGLLWTATADGIFCFNPDKLIKDPNEFIVFDFDMNDPNGISSKDVRAVYEDSKHRIWIGTGGGGLNQLTFDVGKAKFHSYTTKDGLPSNVVTSLICTDDSTMWVGTENGITQFNLNSESFTFQDAAENELGNNFNDHAVIRRRNGKLLWGSLDGLVELDPHRRTSPQKLVKPIISAIFVGGESISHNDEREILDASASYAKRVVLPQGYSDVMIEFSNLDLSNGTNNEYTYILEGYDKKWSRPRTFKLASYNHLEPGSYTFKVKPYAGGAKTIKEIEIVVQGAWWSSTFMTIVYAIALIALMAFGILQFLRYRHMANKSTIDAQIEKGKTTFISELGKRVQTPLSLASKSTDLIVEDELSSSVPAPVMSHMEIIRENIKTVSKIIEDMMHAEKEENIAPLSVERTYVGPFLNEVYKVFEEHNEKMLRCSLSVPGGWHTHLDQQKVEMIVLSLISNAYKRTATGGQVEIIAHKNSDRMCVITVKDKGPKLMVDGVLPPDVFNDNGDVSSEDEYLTLSEANQYAIAHHGQLTYSENLDGTVDFSLVIPTDYSRWEDTTTNSSAEDDNDFILLNEVEFEDSQDLRPLVMVVDDSEDIRNFLQERLSSYYNVMTATDGQNALNKIKQRIPDVVICDANMPVLDGLKFTHKLKMSFLTSHIPVILTNSTEDKSLLRVDKAFAPSYAITKPYSYITLLEVVRKIVNRTQTLRLDFTLNYGAKPDLAPNILTEFKKVVDEIKVNERRENFGIEDLVVELGMPREQIFDCVLTATGCEPGEYVKLWREERVLQYLKKGIGLESALQRIGMTEVPFVRKCISRRQKENKSL